MFKFGESELLIDGVDDAFAFLFYFVNESVLFVEGRCVKEMGAGHGLVLSFFLSLSTFFSRSLEASEGFLGWNPTVN